jgi:hypothetical protein
MPEARLTPEQARFYRERWKIVEEFERRERQAMTDEDRWRRLLAILRFARAAGMRAPPDASEAVQDRWRRLKEWHERRVGP